MSDEMDEIWELYADDGAQALDATEIALEAVMAGDGDPAAHVAALFRAVHTFKGNSRVLGLSVVESRAHLAEDLIGLVRDGGVPLTAEIVDCLMETADILRRMLDETVRTRADVDPAPSEGLMDKLRTLIAKHGGAGAEAAPVDAVPADPMPAPDQTGDAVPAEPALAPSDATHEPAFETRRKAKPKAKAKAKAAPVEVLADDQPAAPEVADSVDAAPAAGPSAAALSLDAGYRTIFLEMLEGTLADLAAMQGGDVAPAHGKADGLSYAAGQLGLADWAATLARFTAGDATEETLAGLIADLQSLSARDFGTAAAPAAQVAAQTPAPESAQAEQEPEHDILADFEPLVSRVADLGLQMAGDTPPDAQTLGQLADDIDALVLPQGLVRLSEAGHAFAKARDLEQFRRAQLAFFEELSALEGVLPEAMVEAARMRPSAILRSWAADHIFATLQDLRLGLEATGKANAAGWFPGFEPLMRRAFHACVHFRMETAAQLTMALVDLFARSRAEGRVPDVILIQIARGFVDTMELVFDTLDQGDTPDIARIEQLFEEAATVSFVASGVVTARVIEDRLGLPREFHRVLSPESVKAAQSAIDAGMRFYVIRSDLNGDDALAERFLEWLTAPPVRMITNVTVFQGDVTLFDFLVAAPLSEDRVVEAMVRLDPTGHRLSLREALRPADVSAGAEVPDDDEDGAYQNVLGTSGLESLRFLETIGEISAGQSMIAAMLDEVSATDLGRDLQVAMRHAGLPALDPATRGLLRDLFDGHMARLRQINEAQAQLSAQLGALQEQSVALRSRPADVLLKPLQAFVSARARELGHGARLSIAGGDVHLDQGVIEQMRGILKRLLSLRLGADPAPRRLHLTVSRAEDQMRVELSDDGDPKSGAMEIEGIASELRRQRATLRRVLPPDGGLRLHLSVPLQMIALEGMVVRVGEVHYVLPIEAIQRIHQGNDSLAISAAGQRRMLRLADSELVPVRSLPRVGQDRGDAGSGALYVIVHNAEQARMAIPVDELLGQQLVLLRPLEGVLGGLRDMSGVAILTGGEVGVVVSVSRLAEAA